jgi:hypothetical protein
VTARLRASVIAGVVVANAAVYAASFALAVAHEPGDGFVAKARELFTDEMPVPCNVWTCGFHAPAALLAAHVLGAISDRRSDAALVLPQLTFLLASSLQTALAGWLLLRLLGRTPSSKGGA